MKMSKNAIATQKLRRLRKIENFGKFLKISSFCFPNVKFLELKKNESFPSKNSELFFLKKLKINRLVMINRSKVLQNFLKISTFRAVAKAQNEF